MEIVKPSDQDQLWLNVLLYGPPKSGKTVGAATAPGAVLMLNVNTPNATRFARIKNPNLIEVRWESRAQTMDEIAREAQKPAGNRIMDTVVVDEVGELYRQLLEEESNRAISPALPTYQRVGVLVERFCRALVEADVNAVFVCHEMDMKDEGTGEVERLPFTGSNSNTNLGRKLLGIVDVAAYCGRTEDEQGNEHFMGQLANAKGRRGGDRYDVLGRSRELDLSEWHRTISDSLGIGKKQQPPAKALAERKAA